MCCALAPWPWARATGVVRVHAACLVCHPSFGLVVDSRCLAPQSLHPSLFTHSTFLQTSRHGGSRMVPPITCQGRSSVGAAASVSRARRHSHPWHLGLYPHPASAGFSLPACTPVRAPASAWLRWRVPSCCLPLGPSCIGGYAQLVADPDHHVARRTRSDPLPHSYAVAVKVRHLLLHRRDRSTCRILPSCVFCFSGECARQSRDVHFPTPRGHVRHSPGLRAVMLHPGNWSCMQARVSPAPSCEHDKGPLGGKAHGAPVSPLATGPLLHLMGCGGVVTNQ